MMNLQKILSNLRSVSAGKGSCFPLMAIFAIGLFTPLSAYAACASPAGNAGDIVYNSAYGVMQFCDGSIWKSMGGAASGGLGTAPSGMIHYWPFNEAAGSSSTTDQISGVSGTVANGLSIVTSGYNGNGINAPTTTPTTGPGPLFLLDDLYDSMSAMTLSLWFKASSSFNTSFFVGNTNTLLQADLSNKLSFFAGPSIYAYLTIPDFTNWHMLTAVFDGTQTGNSNRLKLYLDGTLQAPSYFGTMPTTVAFKSKFYTGSTSGNQADSITLDEIRLYKRALSATEVSNMYNDKLVCIAGDMVYNSASHVYQYCNGLQWVAMGPVPGAGGSGCSSPTGSEGSMIFNSASSVEQYCDGTNWIPLWNCGEMTQGFTDLVAQALNSVVQSGIIAVPSRIKCNKTVSISGASGEFQICSDNACSTVLQTWGSSNQTISPGQFIQAEQTTSGSNNTQTTATVTVGGFTDNWHATTCDNTDISSLFTNLTGQATSTVVTSSIIQMSANLCSRTVSVSGSGSPQFQICSDAACNTVLHAWGSANQTITASQYIQGRMTTSASWNTAVVPAFTVGGYTDNWSVTTDYIKKMFLTSTTYTGNGSGTSGFDADCAARATAASLAGTFKSWTAVTTGTDDPATRFTQSVAPYQEVDGTQIAANWSGLISGTLSHVISKTESGTTIGGNGPVWTNVATNGTAITSGSSTLFNCSGWTTNSNSWTGNVGYFGNTSSNWTNNGTRIACDNSTPTHLYCFQQ
jgi:hypothetical protein